VETSRPVPALCAYGHLHAGQPRAAGRGPTAREVVRQSGNNHPRQGAGWLKGQEKPIHRPLPAPEDGAGGHARLPGGFSREGESRVSALFGAACSWSDGRRYRLYA